jgi:hypothetical protein
MPRDRQLAWRCRVDLPEFTAILFEMAKATNRGRHGKQATRAGASDGRGLGTPLLVGFAVAVTLALVMGGVAIGKHLAAGPDAPMTAGAPVAKSTVVTVEAPPPTEQQPPGTPTGLAADFAEMTADLNVDVGVVVRAVGTGLPPISLGDWQSGPAWSTIKIPLAIAVLREEDPQSSPRT